MTISATDILVPVCSKIPLLYLLTQKVAQKFGYVLGIKNLIGIAMALEYTSEIRHIFSQQKYDTMEELQEIKRNMNKKKAYKR